MPHPGTTILIVESESRSAADIRSSLRDADVTVHVAANVTAALTIARAKRVSGAIIDWHYLQAAMPLCAELSKSNVPYLFRSATEGNVVGTLFHLLNSKTHDSRVFQIA